MSEEVFLMLACLSGPVGAQGGVLIVSSLLTVTVRAISNEQMQCQRFSELCIQPAAVLATSSTMLLYLGPHPWLWLTVRPGFMLKYVLMY
jgi:hypothetical protein